MRFLFLLLFLPSLSWATTYYVCKLGSVCNAGAGTGWATGSDANSGLAKNDAFSNPQACVGAANAGDTCIVGDGTYTDTNADTRVLYLNVGGTSGNPVTYRSENKWGAVLDGELATNYPIRIQATQYVTVSGFKIQLAYVTGVEMRDSHDLVIEDNYIYRNGFRTGECGSGAIGQGSRVNEGSYDVIIQRNLFEENGRDSSLCPVAQDDSFKHDHALYAGGKYVTVRNNIFLGHQAGWAIKIDGYCGADAVGYSYIITNNTFGASTNRDREGVIRFAHSPTTCEDMQEQRFNYPLIQNNIFYEPDGSDEPDQSPVAVSIQYNDSNSNFPWEAYNNLTTSTYLYNDHTEIDANVTKADNQVATATGTTDPANDDFTLLESSSAIDAGINTNTPSDDYAGDSRPQGTTYDIGAYEFTAPTPVLPDPVEWLRIEG